MHIYGIPWQLLPQIDSKSLITATILGVILLREIQQWFGASHYWIQTIKMCFIFLFCLVFAMSFCASVYMCFVVTCSERADLLALLCGVYCESVTFPLISWVRCGTWLYQFLIFAPLLTSIIFECVWLQYRGLHHLDLYCTKTIVAWVK